MVGPMPNRGNLLTSQDVRDRLGCSVRTVHRLVLAGALSPALKLPGPNGAFLFDPDDVDRIASERAA